MDPTTRYLGLALKNPLIASASPLTLELDNIRRLEDRGAAAVVLPSLFEEQIEHRLGTENPPRIAAQNASREQFSYFPSTLRSRPEPDNYVELIRRTPAAVRIPIMPA